MLIGKPVINFRVLVRMEHLGMRCWEAIVAILLNLFTSFLDIEPVFLRVLTGCFCDLIGRGMVAQVGGTLPMAVLIFSIVVIFENRRLDAINFREGAMEGWHVDLNLLSPSSSRTGSIEVFCICDCRLRIDLRYLRL
jgi:hypothetical protein